MRPCLFFSSCFGNISKAIHSTGRWYGNLGLCSVFFFFLSALKLLKPLGNVFVAASGEYRIAFRIIALDTLAITYFIPPDYTLGFFFNVKPVTITSIC